MNRCWSVLRREICGYRRGLSIVNGCATDALASDCISKERKSAGRREPLAVQRIEVPEARKVRVSGGAATSKSRGLHRLYCSSHLMLSSQHCQQEILGAPIQDGLVRFRNRNDSRRSRQQGWQGACCKDLRVEWLETCQQRGFQSGRDAIRFRTLVGGHGNR